MKAINIYVEDEEYNHLLAEKEKSQSKSWRQFLLLITKYGGQK